MNELEYLRMAREIIARGDRWWGAGRPRINVTQMCAIETVSWIHLHHNVIPKGGGFNTVEMLATPNRVIQLLDAAAAMLYPERYSIVAVNDEVGREAVLRCYDLAISEAEVLEDLRDESSEHARQLDREAQLMQAKSVFAYGMPNDPQPWSERPVGGPEDAEGNMKAAVEELATAGD